MSALHLLVPIFFVIQFVVVLLALVSTMLFADPQMAFSVYQPSRRDRGRRNTGGHA